MWIVSTRSKVLSLVMYPYNVIVILAVTSSLCFHIGLKIFFTDTNSTTKVVYLRRLSEKGKCMIVVAIQAAHRPLSS